MDIVHKLFAEYCAWINTWSLGHLGFFPQAALLYGLPTVFCYLAFLKGSRSVLVQTVAFVVGTLLAAEFPVDKFVPSGAIAKTWLFTLSFIVLAFLPAALPKVLTPRLGTQRMLCVAGYIALAGLFLANLFQKGGN
jgi:hypothetical protein